MTSSNCKKWAGEELIENIVWNFVWIVTRSQLHKTIEHSARLRAPAVSESSSRSDTPPEVLSPAYYEQFCTFSTLYKALGFLDEFKKKS